MYVIEPHILKRFIPEDTKYDFSTNLFPILQEKEIPCTGTSPTATGATWARSIHTAMSTGDTRRPRQYRISREKIGENVWVGRNVEISPDAVIHGPVVLEIS